MKRLVKDNDNLFKSNNSLPNLLNDFDHYSKELVLRNAQEMRDLTKQLISIEDLGFNLKLRGSNLLAPSKLARSSS